jgi:hypothetical protein
LPIHAGAPHLSQTVTSRALAATSHKDHTTRWPRRISLTVITEFAAEPIQMAADRCRKPQGWPSAGSSAGRQRAKRRTFPAAGATLVSRSSSRGVRGTLPARSPCLLRSAGASQPGRSSAVREVSARANDGASRSHSAPESTAHRNCQTDRSHYNLTTSQGRQRWPMPH